RRTNLCRPTRLRPNLTKEKQVNIRQGPQPYEEPGILIICRAKPFAASVGFNAFEDENSKLTKILKTIRRNIESSIDYTQTHVLHTNSNTAADALIMLKCGLHHRRATHFRLVYGQNHWNFSVYS
ncbi:unnamed protein product, partial [Ectocarpus sp. 12 AP-2014]